MKNLLFIASLLFLLSCGEESKNTDIVEEIPMFTAPFEGTAGGTIEVKFAEKIVNTPEDKKWIAIVEKSKADKDWGKWKYVGDNASSITLDVPTTAGSYEIRLHGNYPTKQFNVLERQDFKIK